MTRALLLSLCFCVCRLAHAQDLESAGKHFSAAQEQFSAKHYAAAASEFEAAYAASKDPLLLYNVAESYDKAGNGRKAVDTYKAYLAAMPNAQDRDEVQKRIAAIEATGFRIPDQSEPAAAAPSQAGAATPPPLTNTAPVTAPPPEKPEAPPAVEAPPAAEAPKQPGVSEEAPASRMRIGAWIGVAGSLALLTAGAIFGLAAQSRADEINRRLSFIGSDGQPHKFDASASSDLKSLHDDGQLYNGLAIGFYSAAAAAAVATVVLFVVDAKRPAPKKASLAPMFGKNAGGLTLQGSF